jgi:aminocarboxymuconate-semialdehyde decarboxylase
MTVVVDVHAHVIVPEILRRPGSGEGWRPRVSREGRTCVVELGGKEIRSMIDEVVDVEEILERQREAGVDHVLLSPWVQLLFPAAEPEVALERCRIQNESLAALVAREPNRVSALGAVPLQAPELAAEELARIRAQGLAGIEITASVRGTYLGDPSFEPLWEAAEETDALIFVHPTTRAFGDPPFDSYYLWNSIGNPLETTIAAAHMTMAGVMERHPQLRVVLAHGGGALLALRGRLSHCHGFQPQARSTLRESPVDSIRRFYFDTLVHEPELLRALIEFVGPERVLLGSDYPFDMGQRDARAAVSSLGLPAEEEELILGGNARRLLAGSASVPSGA